MYAGCGPFATLLTPLVPKFKAEQLRITLLDVHDRSLRTARLVFETLGLEKYLAGCVRADAVVYRHPRALHLIVTETMLAALQKEPQVAVTHNLAPQLRTGGILVPEKIVVNACLYNPATEIAVFPAEAGEPSLKELEEMQSKRVRIKLGRIFELTAEKLKDTGEQMSFAPVVINIPKRADEKLELMLATTVSIFESVVLEEYESSITLPYIIKNYSSADCDQIEFIYHSRRDPGFEYRCLARKQETETIIN